MIHTHASRGLAWLDLESPTEDEITGLLKRYDLHPLVGEELRSSSSMAKIDFYESYMLVVLTVPVRIKKDGRYGIVDREIDFVIGKNFLITSRFESIDQLEYFAKIFEANSILNKHEKIDHAGHLFYYMVKRLYAGMRNDIENVRDALLAAEERIFEGEERKMVEVISGLSRELIDFKQTARVHRDIWEGMIASADRSLFGSDFDVYVRDIRDEFARIHELTATTRELVADLRETNDSLLNAKQNEIIKTLTLLAFMTFPLALISSLFAIPSEHVPILGSRFDWAGIVLGMILVASAMLWTFKRKRWI